MSESTGEQAIYASVMACPSCQASIEFDRRFTPWCPACEWNVDAGSEPRRAGRFERRRTALARRLAEGFLRSVAARADERPPRWSPATVLVWCVALGVLGSWALLVIAGLALVMSGQIILTVVGVVILLVAVVSRPSLGAAPDEALRTEDAPETYRLLDALSAAMGAPRIAVVALDADWNASTFRFGLRQRHAIVFGIPFWHALPDEARVAILAHEVAHGVNGDTTRGIVVGTALRTLEHWIALTEPDALADETDGFGGLLSLPGNLLLLGISLLLLAVAALLFSLSFAPSLRAELFADRLAARIAGSDAAIVGLETAQQGPAYLRAIQRVALRREQDLDVFAELRHQLAATPACELERLRRQEEREPYRFDQVHPPTSRRIALIRALDAQPALAIDDLASRMRAIDREWAPAESRLGREVVEEYLATLSSVAHWS